MISYQNQEQFICDLIYEYKFDDLIQANYSKMNG